MYPLRNDWDEGTGADYSGANWCRRNAGGDPWASPGADQVGVDHGELAGQADINEAAIEASFKLDPTKWATWQTNNEISVLIVAGSGAMFVYATKESTMFAHPRLEVTTCE